MLFIKAFTSYFHIYRPPTPPTVPSPIVRHPSDCTPRRDAPSPSEKNRRRAVSYVSTGLACLPRDTDARATTAEERLWKPEVSKKRPMVGIPTIGLCIATFCCAITC